MSTMNTVTEILNRLKKDGYTIDFNLQTNCIECKENELRIHPEEFVVDEVFRFEGDSDPDDEAIVYAISSAKHKIKGTLVNGYGITSDELTNNMIKMLKINH